MESECGYGCCDGSFGFVVSYGVRYCLSGWLLGFPGRLHPPVRCRGTEGEGVCCEIRGSSNKWLRMQMGREVACSFAAVWS